MQPVVKVDLCVQAKVFTGACVRSGSNATVVRRGRCRLASVLQLAHAFAFILRSSGTSLGTVLLTPSTQRARPAPPSTCTIVVKLAVDRRRRQTVMRRAITLDLGRTPFKRNVVDVCMRAAHESVSYLRSQSTATSGSSKRSRTQQKERSTRRTPAAATATITQRATQAPQPCSP